ncbi:type VI secretion system baseplate subunit TssE [Tautonia plasticadhaerens]|uniref:Gene 25-like lysozyme n=1 Tax=Tautonia plasticadhaerens TaxID=2527974 RepID=A0A518GW29_9BACT|nr:type VI secretion system baseplate subunit TssE [Tautonia plasticadhaerens]QDV32769.1 Gene 25-like lysozyme [Tautonia plasticadhaerens]
MARPEPDQPLLPSVLDRLIDLEPGTTTEARPRASARLEELKRSVRRDLEWLLNSRRLLASPPPGAEHAPRSLLSFGLPDFSHVSLENSEHREALRRTVEEAISRFEPRLMAVEVTMPEGDALRRGVRFRIEGLLRVEPSPEPVSFDSTLRLPTRDFVVED